MSLPSDPAERKALPIFRFLTRYFPDAIEAMVRVSVAGNKQHNPELPPNQIVWSRAKSPDHLDSGFRHLWDHAAGERKDTDGEWHLAKAMWRIGAELQLQIEADRKFQAPPARPPREPPVVDEILFCGDCGTDLESRPRPYCLYPGRHSGAA